MIMCYIYADIDWRSRMRNKHFIRAFGIPLPETEEDAVERMAMKGYAPCRMTARSITFKPVKPERLRARVVTYDVGAPGYLKLANAMHQQGWEYVCNDGIRTSIFVCSDMNAPDPQADEGSLRCTQREFKPHLIFAISFLAVMLLTFMSNGMPLENKTDIVAIFLSLSMTRKLCFAAMAALSVHELLAVLAIYVNLRILRGQRGKRRTKLMYFLSWAFTAAFLCLMAAVIICLFV